MPPTGPRGRARGRRRPGPDWRDGTMSAARRSWRGCAPTAPGWRYHRQRPVASVHRATISRSGRPAGPVLADATTALFISACAAWGDEAGRQARAGMLLERGWPMAAATRWSASSGPGASRSPEARQPCGPRSRTAAMRSRHGRHYRGRLDRARDYFHAARRAARPDPEVIRNGRAAPLERHLPKNPRTHRHRFAA